MPKAKQYVVVMETLLSMHTKFHLDVWYRRSKMPEAIFFSNNVVVIEMV